MIDFPRNKKWMMYPQFENGVSASELGLHVTDNPLEPESYDFRKWNEGWVEGETKKPKMKK